MKTRLLLAVLALQTAWITGTVALQEYRLRNGVVVLLETVPVDPRDLLRGDYVILNYKISTLEAGLFPGGLTNEPAPGAAVFVRLEQRGEFHEAAEASLTRLAAEEGRPVLRGTVAARGWWGGAAPTNRAVRVEYGLERYFVAEGTGNPVGKLTVNVAVGSTGIAAIKEVFLDGLPYVEAMKTQVP